MMEKHRKHFVSKWQAKLATHMPPCSTASACLQPGKTMYTHLAATRMYSFRMLWMDMILPEPDRDSGSVRTLTIIKLLLAMRIHVSIVTVQRSGKGLHERYSKMLQVVRSVCPQIGRGKVRRVTVRRIQVRRVKVRRVAAELRGEEGS